MEKLAQQEFYQMGIKLSIKRNTKQVRKKVKKMAEAKILATIQRTDTEQLQISVSEYRGKSYFNLRIFYTTDDGATWLPTKKGVTFAPDQLDILEEAIQEAKTLFMTEE